MASAPTPVTRWDDFEGMRGLGGHGIGVGPPAVVELDLDQGIVIALIGIERGEQVEFHDGDSTLFPGLSLHLLPGHAKGLQAVLVETVRGPVLIASDATHTYANLTQNHPFALTIDVEATLNSYRRIIDLAGDTEHVIPGHDALVRTYYPSITVAGIELQVLHVDPKMP